MRATCTSPESSATPRLGKIEDRLAAIDALRRKYGDGVEDILARADSAECELASLENRDQQIESASARSGEALGTYDREAAEPLRTHPIKATDLVCGGNHAFCTTRMHGDPTRGVVDEDGKCHDLDNLYIADTGIFPQCPSVNPMYTGLALARRQAHAILDRF